MKKLLFLQAFCLLCASCSTDCGDQVSNENAVAPVTVSVSGFSVEQSDFPGTRSSSVSTYSAVKFLTLAFYQVSDGSLVYKHTQYRDDASTFTTFGSFSTALPKGNYTMVVLANGGSNEITLTSPTEATYGENRVMDTFSATQAVSITSSSAVVLSATLNRILSAVAAKSTDLRPAEVVQMRFTYSAGSKSFNPTTGFATTNTGFQNLMEYSGAAGTKTTTGGYLFLTADEQTINVTIETLDADQNVLFSKTVENVPLKRNRTTSLTGAIYDNAPVTAGSFVVENTWLDGINVNF